MPRRDIIPAMQYVEVDGHHHLHMDNPERLGELIRIALKRTDDLGTDSLLTYNLVGDPLLALPTP